jgi:hypothetical protein
VARIETDPNYTTPTFSRATAAADPFKKEDVQNLAAAMSAHNHTSGKGLPMAAGSIPNGTITSAMIADGTIATADIAAGAVSQRVLVPGINANPSTTSTTYVDIPDMLVTLTTTGGDLLVWANVSASNSGVGNFSLLGLSIDGAAEVGEVVMVAAVAGSGSMQTLGTFWWYAAPSAASHTIKARWRVSGGTLSNNLTMRQLLVCELKR